MTVPLRLITIPISHYCDKVRWALEYAGIPYREDAHVQGFHRAATRPAGGHSVPLLVTPEGPLTDSADIVRWIDARLPAERRLTTPEARAWEARFDAQLGPPARLWAYDRVASRPLLAWRYGLRGVPWWESALFPLMYIPILQLVRRVLRWNNDTVKQGMVTIRQEFDHVAQVLRDGRPFLCGDRFTIADLTFAAMSAAVLLPPNYGIPLPQPDDLPAEARAEAQQWRAHPAGAFALRLYREHRRAKLA
ncbi:MAG: glutathione S-transferase family protein [Myxococcota bacterium]